MRPKLAAVFRSWERSRRFNFYHPLQCPTSILYSRLLCLYLYGHLLLDAPQCVFSRFGFWSANRAFLAQLSGEYMPESTLNQPVFRLFYGHWFVLNHPHRGVAIPIIPALGVA